MDAFVETSSGASIRLATAWGKPTVLFYEDRESGDINAHVKEALFARGRELGQLDQVSVVAVANVGAWNWFPARTFVLAAVREVERRYGLPVYLDFKGALAAPPWSLPSKGSTVVLLDTRGTAQARWSGKLGRSELDALFGALSALVRER